MTLLDRHIFRSVLAACVAAVALFAFLLTAGNVVRDLLGPLLAGQLPITTFCRLILLLIPFVVSYALPLGMLTGVLLTLGRLSSDNEITAMRAAGLSIPRIAAPAFVLAILGVAVGLRVNFESMPWARVQYHKEFGAAVRANPLSFIVPHTFIREFPGYVIYIGSRTGPEVSDAWVWELDSQHRTQRFIHGETGHVTYDEASNGFVVSLKRAHIEEYDRKNPTDFSEPLRTHTVGEVEPFRLSLARYFGAEGFQQKMQWMNYHELLAEKERVDNEPVAPGAARKHASEAMRVSLTIQDKITMALAVLSFTVIAVPLGIKVSRRETSANLGLAVALALAYYFLTVMVGWLDRHPEYRPDLLLWVPDLVFIGLGAWLLRRIDTA